MKPFELVLLELNNLGCVPRIEGDKFLISNAGRIDEDLREAIAENRSLIIETLMPEVMTDDDDEYIPVPCHNCGGFCDVFVCPNFRCSLCDQDDDTRRENTLRWMKHQRRILKQIEANK